MDYRTIERIKKGLNDSRIGPETIALMLTRLCNLNCIYCRGGRVDEESRRYPDISDELTTESLFELFEDARDFQVKEINLGGMDGEPFCKKDILKIMHKIKQLSFLGSMTTNGSFLNAEVAKIMTDYGWDILLLSFDSAEASIQHRLRPALNQEPYFQSIIQFLETLNRIDSKLRILLNVVISKLNYRKFPELVKFANNYKNIESINVLKMLNMGMVNYEKIQLNNEELGKFKSILSGLKDQKKMAYLGNWLELEDMPQNTFIKKQEDESRSSSQGNFKKCYTNYYILSIDSNGDVIQCPQCQVVVEGLNIKKTPLRDLWKNEHCQFRQRLAENAPCFDGCCTILKEQNKLIYKHLAPNEIKVS